MNGRYDIKYLDDNIKTMTKKYFSEINPINTTIDEIPESQNVEENKKVKKEYQMKKLMIMMLDI